MRTAIVAWDVPEHVGPERSDVQAELDGFWHTTGPLTLLEVQTDGESEETTGWLAGFEEED